MIYWALEYPWEGPEKLTQVIVFERRSEKLEVGSEQRGEE